MANPAIDKVLDRCALVVVTTRMPSPMRDTDEGSKSGSRVVKVLQACFNPEALRPLNKLKTHATRACRAVGTRLETLQAWTVTVERREGLMQELDHIHDEWKLETELLANSIKTRVDDWATLNPSEETAIRSLAPTPQEILGSSRFLKTSFRLRSEDIIDQDAIEDELTSLGAKVVYEVSLILRDASLHKNTGKFFTPEVFDVLGRVREKCKSMAFLDPLLQRISDALEEFHLRMAGQGRITDLDALALHALIQQLLDTRNLLRNGLVVPEVASDVAIPTPSAAAPPAAAAAPATTPVPPPIASAVAAPATMDPATTKKQQSSLGSRASKPKSASQKPIEATETQVQDAPIRAPLPAIPAAPACEPIASQADLDAAVLI